MDAITILELDDKVKFAEMYSDKYWTIPAGVTGVVVNIEYGEYPVPGGKVKRFRIVTLKLSEVIPNLPHPDGFSDDGCDLLCIDGADGSGEYMLECLVADGETRDKLETLDAAVREFRRATGALCALWAFDGNYHGDEVANYPEMLPSFDEFALHVAEMRVRGL